MSYAKPEVNKLNALDLIHGLAKGIVAFEVVTQELHRATSAAYEAHE